MKKSVLALAVLGAFTGAASAQSSVTLFGVADLSLREVKNGTFKSKTLGRDGVQSSRFGLRGVEDLGGGLRASFHFESGLDPGTGAPDAVFWQRRTTVSLLGGFGEIRLGRDLNPTFLIHGSYDPFGTVGVGTPFNIESALGSGAATLVRTSNAVSYITPPLGGFYGQVMVSPSEGVPGNKYTGGRLGFATGPFDISVGFAKTETATVNDYEIAGVGAAFNFGFLRLLGYFHTSEFGPLEQKVYTLSATIPIGQSEIRVTGGKGDMSGGAAGSGFGEADDATIVSVGYSYNLSKRTALYTHYGRIKNDGASRFVVGAIPPAIPAAGGFTSSGYEFGVRHQF